MRDLYVRGMHGLGDNLHQRAIVRQLMQHQPVVLETPWPCVYHDLVGPRLTLVSKGSTLRTQAKNAAREADKFADGGARRVAGGRLLQISYSPADVRSRGSVLAAMARTARIDAASADFRLPVPQAWTEKAKVWLKLWGHPTKPLLIYRPLNERKEWSGCAARNPDHAAYAALYETIREQYFVVSVADFEEGQEWMVGKDVKADVKLHAGELDFETLAALTQMAGAVFSSPGFAIILAQAVGTPAVCVFGGYENAKSFSGGSKFAPYLGIEPVEPCDCFSHTHRCKKRIDLKAATARLQSFLAEPLPTVALKVKALDLKGLPTRYMNAGELEALVALVGSVKPKVVAEFGVNEGRTARVLLDNVKSIKAYHGWDVMPGYVFDCRVQAKEVPAAPGRYAASDDRFEVHLSKRGTLRQPLPATPWVDVVFIDGDHSRAAVEHDTALARAMVRPGGIIIWHDYHHLGTVDVADVLHAMRDKGANINHVAGTWLAFERV